MKIILLSGGSGKRLWPLSNEVRSKQFLKILSSPQGESESMIQRVVRQIYESKIADTITIATGLSQLDMISNQLGSKVDVVAEPSRRDTFPAIALASLYLKSQGLNDSEVITVMPCDVFTELSYFDTIKKMCEDIEKEVADIALMGIMPKSASSKYGYIVPKSKYDNNCNILVERFVEKPDSKYAIKLIAENAYWNGGVFSFKLGFITNLLEKYHARITYDELLEKYDLLPQNSFDYEIVEKAKSIVLEPFDGLWEDLGTWDTLSRHLPTPTSGYVINGSDVEHTKVVNELDIPIVCVGVDNLIISASPDGILIANKDNCENIKEQVSFIHSRPMYEERRWGFYKVLGHTEYEDGYRTLTKLLHINPGRSISYQVHSKRDEVWTFVDGDAMLVIDEKIVKVGRGSVANIKAGQKHAVLALTPLDIIEVQTGCELVEEDITRFEWKWTEISKI